ncbi:acyltransferase family protein [Burkholderia sp. 3C]
MSSTLMRQSSQPLVATHVNCACAFGMAAILIVTSEVLQRLFEAGFLQDGHSARILKLAGYASSCAGYPTLFALLGWSAVALRRSGLSRYVRWVLLDIAWPFVLWSTIGVIVLMVYQRHIGAPAGISLTASLTAGPLAQLWFLYCTLICAALVPALSPSRAIKRATLFPIVCLCIWAGFAMYSSWGLGTQLFWGLFFFQGGYLVGTAAIPPMPDQLRRWAAIGVSVAFVLVAYIYQHFGTWTPMQSLPVCTLGVIAVVAMARFFDRGWRMLSVISWKPVYFLHVATTTIVWLALLDAGVVEPLIHAAVEIFAGLAIPTMIALYIRSSSIQRVLGFQDSVSVDSFDAECATSNRATQAS